MTAQVTILAAGFGSRLGSLTAKTPKALIEVGKRPLIDYALAFARKAGAENIQVVGGFGYRDLAAHVAHIDPDAVCIDNPDYAKGNLISLRAARVEQNDSLGYLIMNTDHIYRPSIAELVARVSAAATEVTAFCDFDRELGPDDMKVGLDGDRVAAMSKQLEAWDAGYVGMTFVPAGRVADHRRAGDRALERLGDSIHVESVLVELAEAGSPPVIADISGHGWLEVDEPHERDHAEATLDRERWW